MSKSLVDADLWPANITCPEDGDDVNGAAMEAFLQQLANRTAFLRNKVWSDTPATVVRRVNLSYGRASDDAANDAGWRSLDADPAVALSVGATRAKLTVPLDHVLPDGATITQVRVYVDPAAAQAVAGNRMSAQVFRNTEAGTVGSSAKTTTDATGDAQWITISGLSITVDKETETYCVAIENSLSYAGDLAYVVEVTFTSSKLFVD